MTAAADPIADVNRKNKRVAKIQKIKGNEVCADCPTAQPLWVSFLKDGGEEPQGNLKVEGSLCVLICDNCAPHHHFELGKEYCSIKYLKYAHEWSDDELDAVERCGNIVVNECYEAGTIKYDKNTINPVRDEEEEARAKFIRHKYVKKKYRDDALLEKALHKMYSSGGRKDDKRSSSHRHHDDKRSSRNEEDLGKSSSKRHHDDHHRDRRSGSHGGDKRSSSSHDGDDKRRSSSREDDKRKSEMRRTSSRDDDDKRRTSSRDDDKRRTSSRDDEKRRTSSRDDDKRRTSSRDDDKRRTSSRDDDKRRGSKHDDDRKHRSSSKDDNKHSHHKDERRSTRDDDHHRHPHNDEKPASQDDKRHSHKDDKSSRDDHISRHSHKDDKREDRHKDDEKEEQSRGFSSKHDNDKKYEGQTPKRSSDKENKETASPEEPPKQYAGLASLVEKREATRRASTQSVMSESEKRLMKLIDDKKLKKLQDGMAKASKGLAAMGSIDEENKPQPTTSNSRKSTIGIGIGKLAKASDRRVSTAPEIDEAKLNRLAQGMVKVGSSSGGLKIAIGDQEAPKGAPSISGLSSTLKGFANKVPSSGSDDAKLQSLAEKMLKQSSAK